MKNELFLALTQLAAERNLDQSIVVSAVKEAIASAYRKDPASKGQDISVEVDSETGDVIVKTILNVKEQENIEDPLSEISEEEAKSDFLVLDENDGKDVMPTIEIECEKCGNNEAVWWMLQTRSADEPTTQFYRCTKCEYTWRNYA